MTITEKKEFPWTIEIRQVDNDGFLVGVGCKTFVFTNKEKLIEAFAAYIREPEGFHKKYTQHEDAPVPSELQRAWDETCPTPLGRNY